MADFLQLLVVSAVMGASIFLALPVVLKKSMGSRTIAFLNAGAIGILIFLVGDVFSNASVIIFPNGYVGDRSAIALFLLGIVASFLVLFALERRSPDREQVRPASLALVVAFAIAFQNLTEGLVFGATWALGITGVLFVIFAGFFLQNVTEGFPIAAPFLGSDRPPVGLLASYFLLAGVPTVLGSAAGYYWNSPNLDVLFDALAIGAIVYAILPMIKMAFRPAETREETRTRQDLVYLGVIAGFAIGFLVNAI
ncbi:MAG: hypothetical protein L3K09_04155 [Thermoplasmata archaeon]|nr:hypothetical protein [Thermoplasmata archaeon]